MSHMPATGGTPTLDMVADDGGLVTSGPHARLNFVGDGVTVTDAGSGLATVTIPGAGAVQGVSAAFPWVDLRATPYSVVANDATAAAANVVGIRLAMTNYATTPATFGFPAGTVYVDRDLVNLHASIVLDGNTHTAPKRFQGQGMGVTTLQAQGTGNSGEWDVIRAINGYRGLTVCDLSIKFGSVTNPDTSKQMHLIMLANSASSTQSIRDVEVYNVNFGACIGAGFRCLGEAGATHMVENVRVHHCTFRTQGIGLGSRSCVEIQRGFTNVEISYCTMQGGKNTLIDMEETTTATEEGCFIHHCWLDHSLGQTNAAVSLGGSGASSLATRCRFSDNYVTGGMVSMLSGDKWEIRNNFISVTGTNAGGDDFSAQPILSIYQTATDQVIEGNTIERSGALAAGPVIRCENGTGYVESYIKISGNTVLQGTDGKIIEITSCDNVSALDNTLKYSYSNAAATSAISVRALLLDCTDVLIRGNRLYSSTGKLADFVLFTAGGGGVGAKSITSIIVTGNLAKDMCVSGVHFDASAGDGSTTDPYPIVQGNDFRGATNIWAASNDLTGKIFPVIAGNAGGICHMVGTVTPANAVTAIQGCRYTWMNGNSTQEFFKSTGTTSSGWSTAVVVP